jgi:hypothetical protein
VCSSDLIELTGKGLPAVFLRGESGGRPGILNAKGLNKRVIYIADGNTLCIEEHIVVCGGLTQGDGGSGAALEGGTLIMKGGEISDNDAGVGMGGGVYVGRNSEFIMEGGLITRNDTRMNGGGVFPDDGGIFTMRGGTISGNTASLSGAGVFVGIDAEFTMDGGLIEKNLAGGKKPMMLAGMPIPGGMGGGVYVCDRACFTMLDGKISGNRAAAAGKEGGNAGSGGGVYVDKGGVFNFEKGSIAQNHAMNWGGGVYTEGSFNCAPECIIGINFAGLGGGGVHIAGRKGVFTMKGGFLLNNFTKGRGGAVNVMEHAALAIENGLFLKNTAASMGNAFAINGMAVMDDGAVFDGGKIPQGGDAEIGKPLKNGSPSVVIDSGGKLILRGGEIGGQVVARAKDQFEDLRGKENPV